jgi:hypothetical protein
MADGDAAADGPDLDGFRRNFDLNGIERDAGIGQAQPRQSRSWRRKAYRRKETDDRSQKWR